MTVKESLNWSNSHYLCRECDLEQWDDFFYPDGCRVCNACRHKIGIFTKEYYEGLWFERGQGKKYGKM